MEDFVVEDKYRQIRQENWIVDRVELLEEMERARERGTTRSEAVCVLKRADQYLVEHPGDEEIKTARERIGDKEEWRFYLRCYAPIVLLAFLVIGYLSGRWDLSVVAAAVVALPLSLLVWGIEEVLRIVLYRPMGRDVNRVKVGKRRW